jgi:hypothetical protein
MSEWGESIPRVLCNVLHIHGKKILDKDKHGQLLEILLTEKTIDWQAYQFYTALRTGALEPLIKHLPEEPERKLSF